jgi:hypothetical protein
MKVTGLPLVVLFGISVAAYAYGGIHLGSDQNTNTTVALNVAATAASQSPQVLAQANVPPLKPYPRLLPLQLISPTLAYAGTPLEGVSVSLQNPGGAPAPNARLRLIIHNQAPTNAGGHHTLSPGSVKIEVLEGGAWKPVTLGMVAGSLTGAIGPEGVVIHNERYKRNGFAIPAGLNKTWQLRLTFSTPGTYTFVTAVSPDNGSRHLAQPAHSTIVVQ